MGERSTRSAVGISSSLGSLRPCRTAFLNILRLFRHQNHYVPFQRCIVYQPSFSQPARTFPSYASQPIDVSLIFPNRQQSSDYGDHTSRPTRCAGPYAGESGELPCMWFKVLPSFGAAWLQRFPPPSGRLVSLALQTMWGSILLAETIRWLRTSFQELRHLIWEDSF